MKREEKEEEEEKGKERKEKEGSDESDENWGEKGWRSHVGRRGWGSPKALDSTLVKVS